MPTRQRPSLVGGIMNRGYTKAWRKRLESGYYNDSPVVFKVGETCLSLAGHKPVNVFGAQLKPGEFITSYASLAEAVKKVGVQQVRTALWRLEHIHGFLTCRPTNKFTIISITKWDTYQCDADTTNNVINKQLTNNQQTTNKQLTTNKNYKNVKKNIYIYSQDFEELLKKYPNALGKKEASRHYVASVKTEEDKKNILVALENYLNHLQVNKWKKSKNASSWFNNWQDWINYKEEETKNANEQY